MPTIADWFPAIATLGAISWHWNKDSNRKDFYPSASSRHLHKVSQHCPTILSSLFSIECFMASSHLALIHSFYLWNTLYRMNDLLLRHFALLCVTIALLCVTSHLITYIHILSVKSLEKSYECLDPRAAKLSQALWFHQIISAWYSIWLCTYSLWW